MEHTPEELEFNSANHNNQQQEYKERPLSQRIVALILIGIVLLGFFGTCYWLAFYGVS